MIQSTRRKKMKQKKRPVADDVLRLERERLRAIMESVFEAIITTDAEGKITRCNTQAQRLTGFTRRQAESSFFSEVVTVIDTVSGEPVESPLLQVLRRKETVGFDDHVAMLSPSGNRFAVGAVAAPMFDAEHAVTGMAFVFHAASPAEAIGNKTHHEVRDALTGLFNRDKFKQRLEELVADTGHSSRGHALLYIDLDKFKIVNDTCGHVAGDQLLRQVAGAVLKMVRQTDLVARLGGDEFGVLLVNCLLNKAGEIAGNICEAVRKVHFAWNGNPFTIAVSVGVVGITPSVGGAEKALSAADGSCYLAKEKGGNRTHVHADDDREFSQRHGEMQFISRITNAFERDLFRLYFQPIVPIGGGSRPGMIWYEILIRMLENDKTVLAPMAFLPAAERYDMMPQIDRWVFSTFFAFFKNHIAGRVENGGFICDINVSGMTLNDDSFLPFVRQLFATYRVPPPMICIEITETAAIANLNQAIRFITELKALGCKFSLDDFGSGLSSFKYLKHLPVDYLKIDGSFVKNILESTIDSAIVSTINEIGHVMGLATVAEFVENQAIYAALEKMGVDYAQGYHIARPRPLHESLGDSTTERCGCKG